MANGTKKIRLDMEFSSDSDEAINEAISKFVSDNKSLIKDWTKR